MRTTTLTPREEQVAQLVANGCSNATIAAELGIVLTTVKAHLKRMFNKRGFKNRVQLAVWVIIRQYDTGAAALSHRIEKAAVSTSGTVQQ